MKLNKEICKKCCNFFNNNKVYAKTLHNEASIGEWREEDEQNWINGFVLCTNSRDDCYFILEQTVSGTDEISRNRCC